MCIDGSAIGEGDVCRRLVDGSYAATKVKVDMVGHFLAQHGLEVRPHDAEQPALE